MHPENQPRLHISKYLQDLKDIEKRCKDLIASQKVEGSHRLLFNDYSDTSPNLEAAEAIRSLSIVPNELSLELREAQIAKINQIYAYVILQMLHGVLKRQQAAHKSQQDGAQRQPGQHSEITLPAFLKSVDAYAQEHLTFEVEFTSGPVSDILSPVDKEEILAKWQVNAILQDKEIMQNLVFSMEDAR